MELVGKSKSQGTKITFLPSKEIFSSIIFSSAILIKRMRELAFLNKGIKISLKDLSQKKEKVYQFKFEGGVIEYVDFLDEKKEKITKIKMETTFKNLFI